MILISIRAASRPQAAARRLCTSRACTSANGEPREPMRRTGVAVEDCAIGPSGASVPNLNFAILQIHAVMSGFCGHGVDHGGATICGLCTSRCGTEGNDVA